MGRPLGVVMHGTPTSYQWKGCRCPDCRAAQREYKRQLSERRALQRERTPATCTPAGARRRASLKRPSDTWPGRP